MNGLRGFALLFSLMLVVFSATVFGADAPVATISSVVQTQTAPAQTMATPAAATQASQSAEVPAANTPFKADPGNPILGKEKSQVCSACHGTEGVSVVPAWPSIAGQSEKYLIKELVEFRKGEKGTRFEPSMYGMTQNLSDQDIADLAAYFAAEKPGTGTTPANFLSLGERIYRGGNLQTGVPACGPSCHGPSGEGVALAGIPRVSGQQAQYTIEQLKKFKSGARSDDPNSIMRDIAKRMSEEEIQAVSNYVSGLH